MKIEIRDLGVIKSGVIDLSKKLNVFCGPNGTGKTYAAYVVYGVLRARILFGLETGGIQLDELIENKKTKVVINFDQIFEYQRELLTYLDEELLNDIFGISEDLTSDYFNNTKILFADTPEEFKARLIATEFDIKQFLGKTIIRFLKKKDNEFVELFVEEKVNWRDGLGIIRMTLNTLIMNYLANYPIDEAYIFPVERSSIFTFSKELSIRRQEALDNFHKTIDKDLLLKRTSRYPLPISAGLAIAEDLAEIKKTKSAFFDFATELENELLQGRVEVSSDGELQFSPERAPKRKLPVQISASIVKSLSSLVIYLKYQAKENDLIIIDEPELNLHPDNQITLTRIFARLISKGFRLLISTHSDYIIRELNNLIMIASDKPEMQALREKLGYNADEALNSEDVNVLYFNYPKNKRAKQIVISPLPVSETGFEVPSIDEVIERQNSDAEALYYTLKYGADE